MKALNITKDQLIEARNIAYNENKHNAYFGNGFKKGFEMAKKLVEDSEKEANQKILAEVERVQKLKINYVKSVGIVKISPSQWAVEVKTELTKLTIQHNPISNIYSLGLKKYDLYGFPELERAAAIDILESLNK